MINKLPIKLIIAILFINIDAYAQQDVNLLGVEVVFMDGTISRLGGKTYDSEGYDLLRLITGSEGL